MKRTIGALGVIVVLGLSTSLAHAEETTSTMLQPCETVLTVEDVAASEQLATECALEGSVVAIDDGTGRTMVVPEEGIIVTSHGLAEEGGDTVEEVSVLNDGDAGVAVAIEDDISGSPEAAEELEERSEGNIVGGSNSPTSSKCSATTAYKVNGAKNHYGQWYWNSSGAPSGALAQINLGVSAITDGLSTTCGTRSNGSFDTYRGTISSFAGIKADGSCTGVSGKNEVSFGDVSGSTLAWTCTYVGIGSISEADIKFDNSNRTWNTSTTGCSGRYDLRGVATHEFGHFFGLGHSAQTAGQVMAPTTGTCNTANRQLGRGDQEGLRKIYGN